MNLETLLSSTDPTIAGELDTAFPVAFTIGDGPASGFSITLGPYRPMRVDQLDWLLAYLHRGHRLNCRSVSSWDAGLWAEYLERARDEGLAIVSV